MGARDSHMGRWLHAMGDWAQELICRERWMKQTHPRSSLSDAWLQRSSVLSMGCHDIPWVVTITPILFEYFWVNFCLLQPNKLDQNMNTALARRFQERFYGHNRKCQSWLNSEIDRYRWCWLGRVWWMSIGFTGPVTILLVSGKITLVFLWGWCLSHVGCHLVWVVLTPPPLAPRMKWISSTWP